MFGSTRASNVELFYWTPDIYLYIFLFFTLIPLIFLLLEIITPTQLILPNPLPTNYLILLHYNVTSRYQFLILFFCNSTWTSYYKKRRKKRVFLRTFRSLPYYPFVQFQLNIYCQIFFSNSVYLIKLFYFVMLFALSV